MRTAARLLAAVALAAASAACTTSSAASPLASAAQGAAQPTAAAGSGPVGSAPAATHAAVTPKPAATPVGVTQTAWGRILDAVPSTFPVFPDATVADPPSGDPVSGTWVSGAPLDEVATWYRDALPAGGFPKVDLGSVLEDGSRVLDAQGGTAACRAQVKVRPAGASTMITVLYAAGCAGG